MKAITPIYDERFLDIQKCIYSVVHEHLQEMSDEDREDYLETLNQEAMGYMLEGEDCSGILAVLYELSEWAKKSGYHFSVNNVVDMEAHLSLLGIKPTHPYTNEDCVVEIEVNGFFELLELLELHWSRIMYNWEFDYDFPENEEDVYMKLGPITFKMWFAEDVEYTVKLTSEWAEMFNVQYCDVNINEG